MKPTALILAAALAATPALADGLASPPARIEILPGWRTGDGTHMAALRIVLEDGWKTYWRAPGEAGIPPSVDWSGSDNLDTVTFHWPVPEVFTSNGMTTIGYHHELVLPFEIAPQDAGAAVTLRGALHLGVCQDICMPMETALAARLSGAVTAPDPAIAAALAARPDNAGEAGVISADCEVEAISDGVRVTAHVDMPALGTGEVAVFEAADPEIWVSEAMTRRAENMLTAVADLVPPAAQPFELDTESLRLTVLADGRAVDIQGCARRW